MPNKSKSAKKPQRERLKKPYVEVQGKKYYRNRGKPEFEPTDEQRNFVVAMLQAGMTENAIRQVLLNPHTKEPISDHTLRKYFAQELEMGQQVQHARVHNALFKSAIGQPAQYTPRGKLVSLPMPPNVGAIRWYEATRRGFKEGMAMEVSGKDGAALPQTVFVIPSNGREAPGVVTPGVMIDGKDSKDPTKTSS